MSGPEPAAAVTTAEPSAKELEGMPGPGEATAEGEGPVAATEAGLAGNAEPAFVEATAEGTGLVEAAAAGVPGSTEPAFVEAPRPFHFPGHAAAEDPEVEEPGAAPTSMEDTGAVATAAAPPAPPPMPAVGAAQGAATAKDLGKVTLQPSYSYTVSPATQAATPFQAILSPWAGQAGRSVGLAPAGRQVAAGPGAASWVPRAPATAYAAWPGTAFAQPPAHPCPAGPAPPVVMQWVSVPAGQTKAQQPHVHPVQAAPEGPEVKGPGAVPEVSPAVPPATLEKDLGATVSTEAPAATAVDLGATATSVTLPVETAQDMGATGPAAAPSAPPPTAAAGVVQEAAVAKDLGKVKLQPIYSYTASPVARVATPFRATSAAWSGQTGRPVFLAKPAMQAAAGTGSAPLGPGAPAATYAAGPGVTYVQPPAGSRTAGPAPHMVTPRINMPATPMKVVHPPVTVTPEEFAEAASSQASAAAQPMATEAGPGIKPAPAGKPRACC